MTSILTNEPDARLLARLGGGDIGALAAIFELLGPYVYRLSFRLMGNHADAEDTTQEVFIRVFEHASKFDGRSRFSTWIYTMTLRHCLNRIQQRSRRAATEREMAGHAQRGRNRAHQPALERLLLMEEIEFVDEMLESLSAPYRACIVLREIEGLSYAQIAEILDIPLGTVMSRLARARRMLRTRVRQRSRKPA